MALHKLSINLHARGNQKEDILNLDNSEKLKMINNHGNLTILFDDENYDIRITVAKKRR